MTNDMWKLKDTLEVERQAIDKIVKDAPPRRPDALEGAHLVFLDNLRASGATNMFGARPYLQRAFGLKPKDAGAILVYWMRTFSERHGTTNGEQQ